MPKGGMSFLFLRTVLISMVLVSDLNNKIYGFEIEASELDMCLGLRPQAHRNLLGSVQWSDRLSMANVESLLKSCSGMALVYDEYIPGRPMADNLARYLSGKATGGAVSPLISTTAFIFSSDLRTALERASLVYEPPLVALKEYLGGSPSVMARNHLLEWASRDPRRVGNRFTASLIGRGSFSGSWMHWSHFSNSDELSKMLATHPPILIYTSILVDALLEESVFNRQAMFRQLFRYLDEHRNTISGRAIRKYLYNSSSKSNLQRYHSLLMSAIRPMDIYHQAFWYDKYLLVLHYMTPKVLQFTRSYKRHCQEVLIYWFEAFPPAVHCPYLLRELSRVWRSFGRKHVIRNPSLFSAERMLRYSEQFPDIPLPALDHSIELEKWAHHLPSGGYLDEDLHLTLDSYDLLDILTRFSQYETLKNHIRYHPQLRQPRQIVSPDRSVTTCDTVACLLSVISRFLEKEKRYQILVIALAGSAENTHLVKFWARLVLMNFLVSGHFNMKLPMKMIDALSVHRFSRSSQADTLLQGISRLMEETDIWKWVTPQKMERVGYDQGAMLTSEQRTMIGMASAWCLILLIVSIVVAILTTINGDSSSQIF